MTVLAPVAFSGRVGESQLESWIVSRPDLAGEDLLVLGRQLHEFEEDLDRLDILAVDRTGEIVLLELKVSEGFRVTDLQALAYAGAYAGRSGTDLAATLLRSMHRTGSAEATLDEACARIVEFVDLDDFDDWEPSQHVRIKLIAPGFPKRVLKTVKWLADVYGVHIEAIQARLFEGVAESPGPTPYHLTFERLLPLPGEDEFDLTTRERENRRRKENISRRRPDIVPLLLDAGLLSEGQELWLSPVGLPSDARHLLDPDSPNPIFRVNVDSSDGTTKFRWHQPETPEPELLSPSAVPARITKALLPDRNVRRHQAVGRRFTLEPGGKTLKEVAEEHGLWDSIEDTPSSESGARNTP